MNVLKIRVKSSQDSLKYAVQMIGLQNHPSIGEIRKNMSSKLVIQLQSNKMFIRGCGSETFTAQNPLNCVCRENSSMYYSLNPSLKNRKIMTLKPSCTQQFQQLSTYPTFSHVSDHSMAAFCDIHLVISSIRQVFISILGSFFRVPDHRHQVQNFPHCAKKVRPSGG